MRQRQMARLLAATVMGVAATQAQAQASGTSTGSQSATAQPGAAKQESQSGAEAETSNPADIIVTARYREERLQDVPIAVTAFSQEQIKDAKIDRVGDFINLTPNVTITQSESSGLSQISIRGITQVRNSEAPVAVVVDGVLQNNPRQFATELIDLASIEVLRGPQGALYGRNATGGAIIITTVQPTNDFAGHVRAGYATGNEYVGEASIMGPIVPDKLLFRIRAVKKAKNNKYILLNAPNDNLDRIIGLLPGMKSPTVLPLAEPGWSSVHSVLSEDEFWEIIEKLKDEGAQGILVVPIEKMII